MASSAPCGAAERADPGNEKKTNKKNIPKTPITLDGNPETVFIFSPSFFSL
jgi:hypothetical protein